MTEVNIQKKEENVEENKKDTEETNKNKTKDTEEVNKKKSTDGMSEDEIIQENLKEILEKKSREERKANGRLVAVIVAFLVIFLAVYHAWIRKTAALAGVLVPAVIMVSYGGWVALLAKRDKQRRALFEKHLEELALKNKLELEEKMKSKHKKSADKNAIKNLNETKLHYENEIDKKETKNQKTFSGTEQKKHHRKHHRQRRSETSGYNSGNCSSSSSSSRQSSSHHATKDLRSKRPSIRQKLFRQNATTVVAVAAAAATVAASNTINISPTIALQPNKKKLQRLDALSVPKLVRMGSAP